MSFTETKYDSRSEMILGTIVSQRDCFMESFCNSICFICISVDTSGQDVRQRLWATHVAYCVVEPTNKGGMKCVRSVLTGTVSTSQESRGSVAGE